MRRRVTLPEDYAAKIEALLDDQGGIERDDDDARMTRALPQIEEYDRLIDRRQRQLDALPQGVSPVAYFIDELAAMWVWGPGASMEAPMIQTEPTPTQIQIVSGIRILLHWMVVSVTQSPACCRCGDIGPLDCIEWNDSDGPEPPQHPVFDFPRGALRYRIICYRCRRCGGATRQARSYGLPLRYES
jgi:hypothetical protein